MRDGEPHRQKHNRTEGKRGQTKAPKERLLSDAEVRFVYEGELKGQWFSLNEAVLGSYPMLPNDEYRVIRLEVRDISEL